MQFTSIGGVTLHYSFHDAGVGRPLLVFINSLGTDFRIWDAVSLRFAGDYSILLYDKRGHGLSDLGPTPYSIDDHVDDLRGLIDHIGAKDIIVCGLSVGGLIAQKLATRRPQQIKALVLCDTAHKIGSAEMWNGRIAAIESGGMEPLADGILERWFTPAFRETRRDELAGCRNMLIRQSAAGYAATCAGIRDADQTELVKSLDVPTLCVVGDQDGSTPPELVKSMADLIPGARFEIIADAGHIPCIEQPEALVALIGDFLNAHRAGA
ncbi:3-oxoadipate enol-lactonase [Oryzicola mucosus]|uniref:3-oxoadipate enol-lactonase n=1 Tax=Oryzicola mucosus TaxID=2767425 RepID=A0A8J6PPL9_9HYPH|nr:3-oxoadipate enol-lactonase [Oryzicola mucosus]